MTREEATRRAEEARSAHQVPVGWAVGSVERRYIEVGAGRPEEPAPVRDLLVWVVQFVEGSSWVELAVDDRTGEVVRVERSR